VCSSDLPGVFHSGVCGTNGIQIQKHPGRNAGTLGEFSFSYLFLVKTNLDQRHFAVLSLMRGHVFIPDSNYNISGVHPSAIIAIGRI
jgi:hypothetical protein